MLESSLNIYKTIIKCSFPLSFEIRSSYAWSHIVEKHVEQISCHCTKTSSLLHIFAFFRKHKQFVNGVFFDLKKYLCWYMSPTPLTASMPLLKQCRSLIHCPNGLRSLINHVPNICLFQGLLLLQMHVSMYVQDPQHK